MNSLAKRLIVALVALCAGGVLLSTPAWAQASRTWVSGVGDDANPCSRTAPCKTFAGAIAKTLASGEINCLDPGGFGSVVITKAITIYCDNVLGAVVVSGTNAFTISAGPADVVTISGLDIDGLNSGLNGVSFNSGAALHIRNSKIYSFATQGISFTPNSTASLYLDNVVLTTNGTVGTLTTGAIKVAPTTGATANLNLSNVRVLGNQNVGLRLDLSSTTTTVINATINDSQIVNSGTGILMKAPTGTGAINAMVTHSTLAANATAGVNGNGPSVVARFSDNRITGNGFGSTASTTGVNALNGATFSSYGSNQLDGNLNSSGSTSNGTFAGTIPPQ